VRGWKRKKRKEKEREGKGTVTPDTCYLIPGGLGSWMGECQMDDGKQVVVWYGMVWHGRDSFRFRFRFTGINGHVGFGTGALMWYDMIYDWLKKKKYPSLRITLNPLGK